MNYVTKILDDWDAPNIFNKPTNDPAVKELNGAFKATGAALRYYYETGQRWVIDPNTLPFIWHTEINGELLEGSRLPHPVMLIEYHFNAEQLGLPTLQNEDCILAPDRLMSLHDLSYLGKDGFAMSLISRINAPSSAKYDRTMPEWFPEAFSIYIPYSCLGEIEKYYAVQNDGNVKLNFEDPDGFQPTFGWPMSVPLISKMNPEQHKQLLRELADDLNIALSLLAILACKNVPTKVVTPDKKLNKKRLRKNKTLFKEYRILNIQPAKASSARSAPNDTRAPLRAHWRRGHIRNQWTSNGHVRRWIRPTIVGGASAENIPTLVR